VGAFSLAIGAAAFPDSEALILAMVPCFPAVEAWQAEFRADLYAADNFHV
jgi:hypothetical protein